MHVYLRRLRALLVACAVLLLAVIVLSSMSRRREVQRALPMHAAANAPGEQHGLSFTRSYRGRTLFSVQAASGVERPGDGKLELRDVRIELYSAGSRRDTIYGPRFLYDRRGGMVQAEGEVWIALGTTASHVAPSAWHPAAAAFLVKTSDLSFDANTGVAETKSALESRTPEMHG